MRRGVRGWGAGWVLLALAGAAGAQAPPRERPVLPRRAPAPAGPVEPLAERAALRAPAVQKRVLALYYPWYGTPDHSGKWLHQDGAEPARKTIASHTRYPASGPYDSTDPATLDRHLQQAKAAGIDTLVTSWWGREDFSDRGIRALLTRAPSFGINVCVFWERLGKSRDPNAATEELSYLVGTLAKQPGYLKEGGKPVVFLYTRTCQSLAPQDWATVLNDVNRRHAPGVLAIGDGSSAVDALLWDGVYALGHTVSMAEQTPAGAAQTQHQASFPAILLARRLGRISVLTLPPGYDDRKPAASAGRKGGMVVDRQGGKLYAALWEQALQDNPDWVMVNSFNQWHTGTEIEPSVELGDRYLGFTAQYAVQFKKPATARTQ